MAHSNPSGLEDAIKDKTPPINTEATKSGITTFFNDIIVLVSLETFSIVLGLAVQTKDITVAEIIPSTTPIARCIGCIKATKVEKGNSVFPEKKVCNTTLKAPS